MITFKNVTTKEKFLKNNEWAGQTIRPIESWGETTRAWIIEDKFGNEWTLFFSGKSGEFIIGDESGKSVPPFRVYLCVNDNQFSILHAVDNGRKIKSDRLLKKYKELALMVSCYSMFGMLNI